MAYYLEFEIKELPKPINAQNSMHWAQKGKYVRHWHTLVNASVCPRKPKAPLNRAKLTLTRFSSSEPDFDGLVSSFKPVIDGLITSGVLENDKFSNIGRSEYVWINTQRGQGKIKVIVEEI